jgi:hypothetical protein
VDPDAVGRVKPLKWECHREAGHPDGEWWTAWTVLGTMDVRERESGEYRWSYCFDEYYDEDSHSCRDADDGKALAEAYYQQWLSPAFVS